MKDLLEMLEQLIDLLRSQFNIPAEAIVLACKTPNLQPHNLPIVLWQYGLIDNSELEQILDRLEVS
ncbi:MAG: DUF2949 domain-containing protein [Cyanobacteria bacterium P01_G01_bin.19]